MLSHFLDNKIVSNVVEFKAKVRLHVNSVLWLKNMEDGGELKKALGLLKGQCVSYGIGGCGRLLARKGTRGKCKWSLSYSLDRLPIDIETGKGLWST